MNFSVLVNIEYFLPRIIFEFKNRKQKVMTLQLLLQDLVS